MHRHPATRLLSTTLAMLMVLYSLPPDVENRRRSPEIQNPAPDMDMLVRARLEGLNLQGPWAEIGHKFWHTAEAVRNGLSTWQRPQANVPAAEAHHNYQHDVPDANTSNFILSTGTVFSEPYGTPARKSDGSYDYKNPFGFDATGWSPQQRSPWTLTLPLLDLHGKYPKDVEYHNSYFSEHGDAAGRQIFAADFLNDTGTQYPRALLLNRGQAAVFMQHTGKGLFSGYNNKWMNSQNYQEFTGSGYGNFGDPKWNYDGVEFALKEHPWWRFGIYESSLNHIKNYSYDVGVKKRESLYYWETNPYVVAALQDEVDKAQDNEFLRGRPQRIKGFWVEVQPYRAGAFQGLPDYPLTDSLGVKLPFPFPIAGLRGEAKYSKLTFYRPYAPKSNTDGSAGIGFFSSAEASLYPDQHDPVADFVCVGAYATYDRDDADIANRIAGARSTLWGEKQLAKFAPQNSPEGKKLAAAIDALPPVLKATALAAAEAAEPGSEDGELLKKFLLDVYEDGVEQGVIANTFSSNSDPTDPAHEANATTKPPALFASSFQVDPVDVVSGSNYHDFYDLQLTGRGMRTDFLRTYNSNFRPDETSRGFMPLGYGWTHTYNQFLFRFPDNAIAYYNDHGQSTVFMPSGNGYRAPPGTGLSLTQLADGSYQVRDKEGMTFRFSGGLKRIATEKKFFYEPGIEPYGTTQPVDAGRLLSLQDRNGNRFDLSYANGKLVQVTDPSGRKLGFTYQGERIAAIIDPAGRTFQYGYQDDNLVEVVHPGGARQAYTYSGHLMTGHSDRNAEQMWRFTYNTGGKVTQVLDPEGNRTEFAYAPGKTVQTTYEVDGRAYRTEFDHQNGEIIRKKDPQGTVFDYEYANHRKVKETYNRGDRPVVLSYEYDDRGNLIRQVDASGQETTTKYDATFSQPYEVKDPTGVTAITLDGHGNVTSIRDPVGRMVTYVVDEQGQTQAVIDPGQHRTATERNAYGLLSHIDTPIGGWTTYSYDVLGRVTSVVDPTGTRRYEYAAAGHLRTYTDQLGRSTVFEADANGNVTQITEPGGRITQLDYDKKNQLRYTRNHAGAETRYAYTSQGQMWRVTDANGNVTQFERDGNGRVTRIVDPRQNAKTFTYDAAGNVLQMANELGEVTRYAYDPLNRVSSVTDPMGNATALEYYPIGAIKRITNPRGFATQFMVNAVGQVTDVLPPAPDGPTHYRYNADGTLQQIERQKGQVQQFTYNGAGQILTVTDSRKTTRYEYDAMGRLTGITAPGGRKQTFQQDALGRIKTVTDAFGNPTEYEYWPSGEVKSIRKVNGAVTEFTYDAAGKISRVSAPEGRVTQLRHDKAGNLIEKISPTGAQTSYVYDALNRLVEVSELSKGAKSAYQYDAAGRLTSLVDANGQTTTMVYDRMGRPVRVNAPLQQRMELQYDQVGNLLRRTDANDQATTYAYDPNNRVSKVVDPLQHASLFKYDELGNLSQVRRLADGATTTIRYNDLNLPEEVVDPLQNRTRMQYDEFGNLLARLDAKNRTTRYQYDAMNRLVTVAEPLGKTTQLAYDRIGNLERTTNALGVSTRRVYDLADRLRFVYEPLGRTTEYRYNALDQVTLVRDANGNQMTVDYDKVGRPIRRMNGLGYSTDFFYDRLDRLTRKTDALGHSTQYGYDELSRLTRVTDPMGYQTRYQYDTLGNMTSLEDARGKRWTFHYDELNRMDWERDPLQRTTQFVYDVVGNLSKKKDGNGVWTDYQYDKLGRVRQVQTPDDLASFTYDEVGNTTGYQNRQSNIQRRFDDLNRLTEESNLTWAKTTRFTYDVLDRLSALTTPQGRLVRYEYDDLNQLRTLIDPEGNRTNYQYDRGGRLTSTEYPSGVRSSQVYDPADQVTSLQYVGRSGQRMQGFSYDYDRVGNRTQTRELDGALTQFQYDALDRLEAVSYPVLAILADRQALLAANQRGNRGNGNVGQPGQPSEPKGNEPFGHGPKDNGPKLTTLKDSGLGSSKFTILSVRPLGANNNGQGNGNGNGGGNNPPGQGNGNNDGSPTQPGNGNGGSLPPGQGDNGPENGSGSGNGSGPGNGSGNQQGPGNGQGTPGTGNGGNDGGGPGHGNGQGGNPSVGQGKGSEKEKQGNGNRPANPGKGDDKNNRAKSKGRNAKEVGRGRGTVGFEQPGYWYDPVPSVRYTYDQVGNRLTESDERGTLAYTYDDANQLKRVGDTAYEYDGNGNRIAETTAGESVRYRYDAFNQLTGIRYADRAQSRYDYDPMGRLIQSERPDADRPTLSEITRYMYAGQSVLGEFTETGAPLAEYYSGNGEVVTRRMFGNHGRQLPGLKLQTRGNHLYYMHDALGSVTGMTDHQGNRLIGYREDAFGQPQAGLLDFYNSRLLTGKSYDSAAGLYYFGSRWYDPGTGRFMSQDSYRGAKAEPRSLHRYAYVLNNPASLIDAWGYQAEWKPQPSNNFFTLMGEALGGAYNAAGNAVAGMVDLVRANPWQAVAIGVGAAALIAAVIFVPGLAPALGSVANFLWQGVVAGAQKSAIGVVGGLTAAAVTKFSPQLANAIETLTGVAALSFGKSIENNRTPSFLANAQDDIDAYDYALYNSLKEQKGKDSSFKLALNNMPIPTDASMGPSFRPNVTDAGPVRNPQEGTELGFENDVIDFLIFGGVGKIGVKATVVTAKEFFEVLRLSRIAKLVSGSTKSQTVLGRFPAYTRLAETLGARKFQVDPAVWDKMSDAERWAANQKFLDETIERGDEIILASSAKDAKNFFARELDYLREKGYRLSSDGLRMIKGD